MKRREFLKNSAALAGIGVPSVLRADSRPCPPGTASVVGGTSATSTCLVDELADWMARSAGRGVVWTHNFEYDDEVTNFVQWPSAVGYGPDYVRGIDGIAGGGCLEITVPAADVAYARDPTRPYGRGGWVRPYSPLKPDALGDRSTGNGKGTTDPGDALIRAYDGIGAKTWRTFKSPTWNPYTQFRGGVYGHSDYKTDAQQGQPYGWIWEGDESTGFYIQCRIKLPMARFVASRVIPANGQVYPAGDPLAGQVQTFWTNTSPVTAVQRISAKSMWFGHVTSGGLQPTTPAHEIVLNHNRKITGNILTGFPVVYSGQNGSWSIVRVDSLLAPGDPGFRWEWPADKWVTVLMYVKPGHFNRTTTVGSLTGGDGTVQFWVAMDGGDYVFLGGSTTANFWAYGPAYARNEPLGWNALAPTNYANGPDEYGSNPANYRNPTSGAAVTETWQLKVTQIIFSKEFIPSPRA